MFDSGGTLNAKNSNLQAGRKTGTMRMNGVKLRDIGVNNDTANLLGLIKPV